MTLYEDQRKGVIDELIKVFGKLKNVSKEELKEILKEAGLELGSVKFILKSDSRIFESLKNLSLKEIRESEIQRCLKLGFHQALGLSKKEFSSEDIFPMPEDKPSPLAVIPEIITLNNKRLLLDISIQMSLIKVGSKKGKNYLDLKRHKDLIEIPDKIHWVYEVEDGSRFAISDPITSPKQEVEILKKEKRTPFATVHGIALIRRFPEALKHHCLDLASSGFGSGEVSYLGLDDNNRPGLGASDVDNDCSGYGVPSFCSV